MALPVDEKVIPPKKKLLYKFVLLCVFLASYFAYLSFQYGVLTGGMASALTWSFFVLCTPIADAGFLLDFPLRLLFGIRMLVSEMVVWTVAITLNVFSLIFFAEYYDTTSLTKLLHAILTMPFPYWSVIMLSAAGTFLSIRFADELMDVVHHRDRSFYHRHGFKHELLVIVFFVIVLVGCYKLIASLGIEANY